MKFLQNLLNNKVFGPLLILTNTFIDIVSYIDNNLNNSQQLYCGI